MAPIGAAPQALAVSRDKAGWKSGGYSALQQLADRLAAVPAIEPRSLFAQGPLHLAEDSTPISLSLAPPKGSREQLHFVLNMLTDILRVEG